MQLDSYEDAGVIAAVELINALAPGPEDAAGAARLAAIAGILAVDPPSLAMLKARDVPGFVALAERLRQVFDDMRGDDIDAAAALLNQLLAEHPAHPHLAKEEGRWRLHHHPVDVALVPMWASICAEALARMIASGHAHRFGTCEDAECNRVFFDVSRNGSRRFCSTTCQNRIKAAAFRRRQGAEER